MELAEIVKLFVDNGVTIAVLVYFCVRDWKFMNTLVETLTTLKVTSSQLVTLIGFHIEKENDDDK